MSVLTRKYHERFWERMAERFGQAWGARYGDAPVSEWCAMLDRYSPQVIKTALELMQTTGWQFPPTMPQFEELLRKAARSSVSVSTDFVGIFWRSFVLSLILGDGWLIRLWGYRASLASLPAEWRAAIAAKVEDMASELALLERNTGERTPGLYDRARRESWAFVATLRAPEPVLPKQRLPYVDN
jgi:hypothetical protein